MDKVKLFCFPYAGGTATTYLKWKKHLDKSIELHPIEMAGRGRRFGEPLETDMQKIVGDLYASVKKELDGTPYILYGHSMGTVSVYEIMERILKDGYSKPLHVFVSGRYPPHIDMQNKISHLPDNEFIEEIKKVGGTQEEVFENKEILNIFLPILRADYKAIESYVKKPDESKWDIDITVLNGVDDEDIKPEDVKTWEGYTTGKCDIHYFEGGHFFINDAYLEITNMINNVLSK